MRVLIIGAAPYSLVNFRGELIKELVKRNCEVIAMAGLATSDEIKKIETCGAKFVSYPVARNSSGILNNLKTFWAFRRIIKGYSPDVVLSYTIKPVIWTGISLIGNHSIKFNALITGLGYAFEGAGFRRATLKLVVSFLYKLSLTKAEHVIFQNQDDKKYFEERLLVHKSKTRVVAGSGVPLDHFAYKSMQFPEHRKVCFLMIARLINEKGVRVYFEAARIVKKSFPHARFRFLGPFDPSPDGIGKDELDNWVSSGDVEYLGESQDVRPFIEACNVFVLPSFYREGLPRTILEAMAIGRPILTTDNVGCREPISEGYNGWLVPVRDIVALAERMAWCIKNPEKLSDMGLNGRKLVEKKYNVKLVNQSLLNILEIN